jgi:hypothetical protein
MHACACACVCVCVSESAYTANMLATVNGLWLIPRIHVHVFINLTNLKNNILFFGNLKFLTVTKYCPVLLHCILFIRLRPFRGDRS